MASLNLKGFEKISTNVDIMEMIFHYLNFEEQLKLAQVSQQLKYVFCNFIWKVDYTTLDIEKKGTHFCVVNKTGLDKKKLSSSEIEEFLKVYGENIKELKEIYGTCTDIRKYPNLIALDYYYTIVRESQLELVAKYCKKLQNLKIYSRYSFELDIKTILKMKQLKYLSLTSNSDYELTYNDYQELVTKSQIKHLSVQCKIRFTMPIKFNKISANYLEELEFFFDKEWYKKDLSCFYLSHFENLVTLTLNVTTVDDDAVKVLADNCKKLKKLNFILTRFQKVTNFSLLNSIEELNVKNCSGLSQTNLRQLLTEMNLKNFSSFDVVFDGEFENFVISSQIQSLDIGDLQTYEFKGAYEMNENLRSLVWYDYFFGVPLQPVSFKCPRLERLEVVSGSIPIEMLLQLQSLQTLTIKHADYLTWTYVIKLLRDHVSLKEFKLDSSLLEDPGPTPKEAFSCAGNIKSIQILIKVFDSAVDFWLDLMGKNSHVKLVCTGLSKLHSIENFVNNPKFPHFIKTIYINGFKFAVSDLRHNFEDTLMKAFPAFSGLWVPVWKIIF